jgi:hypothetical protein
MQNPGSAGGNTAADHLAVLDAAIAALPPGFRRRLMVTCDGAGASHDLIARKPVPGSSWPVMGLAACRADRAAPMRDR